MLPLFIDCDPGIDDAVALGYALCQPDVEILGVAASAGNVPVDQVTTNALAWLQMAGRPDIPVHPGSPHPLTHQPADPEPEFADDTHGPTGTGHAALPRPATAPSDVSAAQAWVRAARNRPGELIGVVLGPCTNLALALRLEPNLPNLLKRVFIMGGAFNYRGNTKPTTEWNINWDPEAAAEVFAAFSHAEHLPVVGPIEATEAVVMTPQRLATLTEKAKSTPDGDPTLPDWSSWLLQLAQALRFYFEFHEADGHGYLAQIHDPYVTAAAIGWGRTQLLQDSADPAVGRSEFLGGPADSRRSPQQEIIPWAQTATAAVDVELTGTLTRGETVADWLGRWGRTPNAVLIRQLDAEDFLAHLTDTLKRGPHL